MIYSLYDYLFFFITYAFLGWCSEVCFCSINTVKFVNRGFLNGPVCPIYGFGMIIVLFFLTPLQDNLVILFIGAFLLTSLLEGVTGWVLKKLFHTSWWDYSDLPYNIGGYVCLKFSILWGMGACFIVRLIHPIIYSLIRGLNHKAGIVFLWGVFIMFSVDVIVTVATMAKLDKDLGRLGVMAARMHDNSEKIAQRLGNTAIEVDAKVNAAKMDSQVRYDIAKAEFLDKKSLVRSHLLKAFPDMKHERFDDILNDLKGKYSKK